MKYELEKIDSLIEKYLYPDSSELEKKILKKTDTIITEIEFETKRIKKSFGKEMFSLKNDKQIERYIQRHQACLIRLCNSIINQFPPDNFYRKNKVQKINSIVELQFYFYSQLEQILSYIETYFGKYFNQEEHIPRSYRIIGQMEFREKLSKLKAPGQCDVLKLAQYPVDDFINQNKNISYKKLIYLKELYNEVISKCEGCKKQKTECKISNSLLYLNFNSFKFFSHLTNIIKADIQKEEDITRKIEKLSFHQKKLNQVLLKPNFAYKPKQDTIKEKVGTWIYEELSHYEKIQQLSFNFPKEASTELGDGFKLSTDMSVPQVAYFIRILVNTGIINNKNQKEVIVFFAKFLKTKKTRKISTSSFHNKYYNIDLNTKEDMKDRIIRLLNETQRTD